MGLALLVAAPAAHAQSGPPNVPWPQLLPPGASPADVQPKPMRDCRRPTIRCIDRVVRRLTRVRDRMGCDHRAVFADTYLVLTKQIRKAVRRNPRLYRDLNWLIYQDVVFANFYFPLFRSGATLPEAWQIAFNTAASGNQNAAQDMLLGINAHVQRDMPYVLATVGLRTPDGKSRKRDHDIGNEILADAYEAVVRDVERRYDPILAVSNSNATPLDDFAGLELVKGWREGVWRNAERLLNARTQADRQLVDASIERNAAEWARQIAAFPGPPGYREQRDAYCAERLR